MEKTGRIPERGEIWNHQQKKIDREMNISKGYSILLKAKDAEIERLKNTNYADLFASETETNIKLVKTCDALTSQLEKAEKVLMDIKNAESEYMVCVGWEELKETAREYFKNKEVGENEN